MDKKAQGLSVNTIIIAIIALVVLVVILAVFTGGLATIFGSMFSCNDGSTLKDNHECVPNKCSDGFTKDPILKCSRPLEGTCCVKIENKP